MRVTRCSDCKCWPEPDRAANDGATGPTAYTSPCPLLPGEGSPRFTGTRLRLHGDNLRNQSPPLKPVVFFPRPARPRGLSRGIVRPDGRAVSVLNSRRGLEWRRGLVRAKPGPARPEGTARHLKRTARGVRRRQAFGRFDISTSTSTSRQNAAAAGPRAPLGIALAFEPSRREPAGPRYRTMSASASRIAALET